MSVGGVAHFLDSVEQRSLELDKLTASQRSDGTDFGLPDVVRSHDALSVVPPADTFFLVGDPARPSYSADGAFAVRDGVLVRASDGLPVLGIRQGAPARAVPQPLALDRRDVALGDVAHLRVESDGRVSYSRTLVDPATDTPRIERVNVGTVALARFPAGSAPQPAMTPLVGYPNDGSFAGLATYSRREHARDALAAMGRFQNALMALGALGASQRVQSAATARAIELVK